MTRHIHGSYPSWPLVAVAALSVIAALADYFTPEIGIDGTTGALVVIVSTALMLLAAAAILFGFVRGWARGALRVLIALDILGTAFAAYMLEANILLGLMALALIAWVFAIFAGARQPRAVTARATS